MSDDRIQKVGIVPKIDQTELDKSEGGLRRISGELDNVAAAGQRASGAFVPPSAGGLPPLGKIPAGPASSGGGGRSQLQGQDKNFRKASKGLRQLGDAAQFVGGETGLVAGQLLDMGSQLPQLAEGAGGLKGSIGGLISSLGPAGIIGGVAAIGLVGALAFGVNELSKANKKAVEATEDEIESIKRRNDALTKTTDEIMTELNALEEERLGLARDLVDVGGLYNEKLAEENEERSNFLGLGEDVGGFLFDMADGLGLVGSASETAADDMKTTEEAMEDLTDESGDLAEALNSTEVAANDARESMLDQVDQIGELRRFESAALKSSAEENKQRLDVIQEERSILQEQVSALKANGDTSKEVTDKINELNAEMGTLDKQTAILTSDTVKAAEAQSGLSNALADIAAEQRKIIDLENKIQAERVANINKLAMEERKAGAEFTKLRQEGFEDFRDLIDDQRDADLLRAQDHQDNLIQIEEDGNRDADKLANDFKFLAAARERRDIATSGQKAQEKFNKEQAIVAKAKIEDRKALVESIEEEQEIKKQQIEQDLEQKRRELVEDEIQGQKELQAARQAGFDKLKSQNEIAQQEVELASAVGKAQIDITQQVLSFAEQSAKGLAAMLNGAGFGGLGGGGVTNQFNFPNGGTNLAESGLSPAAQAQVGAMIAMGSKIR